jgi:hypothetical protein
MRPTDVGAAICSWGACVVCRHAQDAEQVLRTQSGACVNTHTLSGMLAVCFCCYLCVSARAAAVHTLCHSVMHGGLSMAGLLPLWGKHTVVESKAIVQ